MLQFAQYYDSLEAQTKKTIFEKISVLDKIFSIKEFGHVKERWTDDVARDKYKQVYPMEHEYSEFVVAKAVDEEIVEEAVDDVLPNEPLEGM
ncbi:hypothetical protein PFISCL1PPCAC_8507 [Pristionchus fissidentatus]|uniref:Uncharacterized protein n=1 Tax=Pristionchus fissidentatus TaxID=1538716 RepID=A0AAV5VBZ2_9BILA|nr:hypothetical protein PFISCL1PPCAC_8507 [Pristionchus fissidentatus]